MQAVILVGGLGTRLREITKTVPKPMIQMGNKPFLDFLITNLVRYGINSVLLLTGYKTEYFEYYYKFSNNKSITIDFSVEYSPAGTAGALLLAKNKLQDEFLLLNGDSFFDFNILDLIVREPDAPWLIKLALRETISNERYGSVLIKDNRVLGFLEKNVNSTANLISCGVYHVKKQILSYINNIPCSLEVDIMPQLVNNGLVWGYPYEGYFIDIGVPDDLKRATYDIPNFKNKVCFLDRDGVINVDKGYVYKPNDVEWIADTKMAIKYLNDKGFLVIVITNQAGVARGFYTEEQVHYLHEWINRQLAEIGAHIDAFYYCPHHPTAGKGKYLVSCLCRKPEPGMLLQAIHDFSIDIAGSFLIGDMDHDLEAAERLSIKGFKYKGGSLLEYIKKIVTDKLS